MFFKFALLVLVVSSSSSITLATAAKLSPVVDLGGLGKIQGLQDEVETGIFSFKNVPFAQPPVGELRFADPLPVKPWAPATLNATVFGPGCPTFYSPEAFPISSGVPKSMSEDCLQLNVYTPTLPSSTPNSNSTKLAVAVWIYGGDYDMGAASVPVYDGSDLSKNQQLVVVSCNYRLNVFGGMYLGVGGKQASGNQQMKDQQMCMKFVQEHIAAFGGDKDRVVIFGQSAGGMSVTTHMTLPSSKGLFSSALSLSNPMGQLWRTPDIAETISGVILKNISCPNDGSEEMMRCVRAVPVEKLVAAALDKKAMIPALLPHLVEQVMVPWAPVVDGFFLPQQPVVALATGRFNKRPFVVSTVANESNMFTRDLIHGDLPPFEAKLLMDLMWANKTLVHNALNFYFGGKKLPCLFDCHLAIDPMMTDALFYAPTVHFARLASKFSAQIWQVQYTYAAENLYAKWMFHNNDKYCARAPPGYKLPVCHAADLWGYWFSVKAIRQAGYKIPQNLNITDGEKELSRLMQSMVGGLAREGTPGKQFPPMTPKSSGAPAMMFNLSIPAAPVVDYRAPEVEFWAKQGFFRY